MRSKALCLAQSIPITKGGNQTKYFPMKGTADIYGKIIKPTEQQIRNSEDQFAIFINKGKMAYSKIIALMNHHVAFMVGVLKKETMKPEDIYEYVEKYAA